VCFICFFVSSRRRHTRFSRDWSSDVCSSDLGEDMRGIKAAWAPVPAHLGSLPIDGDGYIVVRPGERVFNPAKHYLWPIPAQQIQYNPNLEQNPNWEQ